MAPSLEKIHFSRTAIQLMDIKSLHAVLSKLKEITLDHIYLYEEEEDRIEDDNLSQHPPAAEGVVSISLSGISPVVNRQIMFAASQVDERFSNTLCRWISYIGSIYKHLQELALLSRSFSKIDKSLVSTSLADALVNLKNITSYSVYVCFLSDTTLGVMDRNNIELEHLMFEAEAENPIEEIFQSLQSATSTSALVSLEYYTRYL